MSEIKTCEAYVLAELEAIRAENEHLRDCLREARGSLEDMGAAMDALWSRWTEMQSACDPAIPDRGEGD